MGRWFQPLDAAYPNGSSSQEIEIQGERGVHLPLVMLGEISS
jgi:hypothetical protein